MATPFPPGATTAAWAGGEPWRIGAEAVLATQAPFEPQATMRVIDGYPPVLPGARNLHPAAQAQAEMAATLAGLGYKVEGLGAEAVARRRSRLLLHPLWVLGEAAGVETQAVEGFLPALGQAG